MHRTVFISDVHLGSRDCKAEALVKFLRENKCERLYLIGDIIDGWKIQQNRWRWNKHSSDVISEILKHPDVVYITGNHDEFLRRYVPIHFHNIKVLTQTEHVSVKGEKWLVIHGDQFDGLHTIAPALSLLGDYLYDLVLRLNTYYNRARHFMGFGYYSISQRLKLRVKKAVDFIFKFESNIIDYAKKREYDGVICGHIHKAEIKPYYMNTGDWVESMTAIVEDHEGNFKIVSV